MIEYRCAQSSVKSKIDLTRFFPVLEQELPDPLEQGGWAGGPIETDVMESRSWSMRWA